jgi:hypothetical protein
MKYELRGDKYVVFQVNNPDEVIAEFDCADDRAEDFAKAFIEGYLAGFRDGKIWSEDD